MTTLLTPSIIKLKYGSSTATEWSNVTTNPQNYNQLTLSDHSRSPLSLNYEIIEKSTRMVNGTMRKYVVSKKTIYSCSWEMLPTTRSMVVDGNADAKDVKEFYDRYCFSPLTMTLYFSTNATERGLATKGINGAQASGDNSESKTVFWTNLTVDVVKRYRDFDYWNMSAEFTEV